MNVIIGELDFLWPAWKAFERERKGNLGARPRAREKGGEESVPLPPFSRALKCFSRTKTTPSLPFRMSSTGEKEEYVFTCNIEILVNKPSHYLNSIFVIYFLPVSAVCFYVFIKAFNKRQSV